MTKILLPLYVSMYIGALAVFSYINHYKGSSLKAPRAPGAVVRFVGSLSESSTRDVMTSEVVSDVIELLGYWQPLSAQVLVPVVGV